MSKKDEYSDSSEMWRQFNAEAKERRVKRTERNSVSLHDICQKLGVDKKAFNTNSWRLTKGDIIIDYYPPSNRAFDHKTKKWFDIPCNKLEKGLTKIFK